MNQPCDTYKPTGGHYCKCHGAHRPCNCPHWPPWYKRVMPWLCLSLLALTAWFMALVRRLVRSFPLPMVVACAVLAAMAPALAGCNSSLVKVDRTYHFHAPVYYPQVTVEKQIKAGGMAR